MKILVVNDSPVLTAVITAIVETNSDLYVAGTARNGIEAVNSIGRISPDLVLMDIHMPKMGGVEATKRIISTFPRTKILITSATIKRNMKHIFNALQYGAFDYVRSPSLAYASGTKISTDQLKTVGSELLNKIATVSKVSSDQLVKTRYKPQTRQQVKTQQPHIADQLPNKKSKKVTMLAIGCSTGGPTTVAMLLSNLKRPFPVPILICQHIGADFTQGFVSWITEQTGFAAEIAKNRSQPDANKIYVAPGGNLNLEISSSGRLMLTNPNPEQTFLPNISHLFTSMAHNLGSGACGVVLTGMGNDGSAGLDAIKRQGGTILAQDRDSSVVDAMPAAARKVVGGELGYPPVQLASKLNTLVEQ